MNMSKQSNMGIRSEDFPTLFDLLGPFDGTGPCVGDDAAPPPGPQVSIGPSVGDDGILVLVQP
jgi:hypothetical protein